MIKNKSFFAYFLILVLFASAQTNAQNYADGNGTILKQIEDNEEIVCFRKHVQKITLDQAMNYESFKVYEKPGSGKSKVLGYLSYGDTIVSRRIFTKGKYNVWLEVQKPGLKGWVKIDTPDPYSNNTWEIVEYLESRGKIWTVRRLNSSICVYHNLNIRNKPGIEGTRIIGKINANTFVEYSTITEETDEIDGIKDHWIRIKYNGISGWIFGGYADVERGGPKYFIPESLIYLAFIQL